MAADEKSPENQPVAPIPAATSSANDDLVSLEDLVRDTPPMTGLAIAESVSTIDQVLSVEDPAFASELAELKTQGATPDGDIAVDHDVDKLVQQEKIEQAAKGFAKIKVWLIAWPKKKIARVVNALKGIGPWFIATALPALKAGLITSLKATKTGLGYVFANLRAGFGWFGALPLMSKALVGLVIIFTGAIVVVAKIALTGHFLPSLERDFLTSFALKADQTFEIPKDEVWEDLNDPLLHPEHIVLLERLVVNLRAPGDGTNPMALIDLYIEAGSQDAAVEVKDRDAEIRDMTLRTLEQMDYDELVTETGKAKLKVFLRKNLNDMMTRGRIRRVFYKSIVLKP